MIFASERGNAHNLFSMELESGEIEQITDFPVPKNLARYDLHMSYVDGVNARCVCFMGKELLCIIQVLWKNIVINMHLTYVIAT